MEEKVKDRRLSFSYLLTELKALLIIIAIFIACFIGGWFFSNLKSNKAYKLLLDQNNEIRESLTVADNKATSLESLLSGRDQETEDLRRIIAAFEDKPAEIRYVVRTETIIEGNEEVVIDMPPNYIFAWPNGLQIAKFENVEDGYSFQTFDIEIESDIIVSTDETSLLIRATSSAEPDTSYTLEVDRLKVSKVRDQKLFEPHIGIGATASLNVSNVTGDFGGSPYVTFIHPNPNLDILGIRITIGDNVSIGLDPVYYNVGDPLPLFTDLWIGAGVSFTPGVEGPSIDFTIGSKF